ncbi:Aste57867_22375 [Aphanomyces stellatus]|uniref:tRNA (guanosine(18)-2'-O)-methyltransferase TARBP1 n=1 Tax=Aphanomyces stellatus TaxID=120398 RepID=A0A485LJX2_9STRA|nr:hypothetical protein As57867_022305 [Aphanomyces stellatus]VFT99038.1 Aste57867_22375 [Aphanomyces stellatus]
MPTSNAGWAARVRAAYAICKRRNVSSPDDFDLLALGLVSSLEQGAVVELSANGTLLSIVLPLAETTKNTDESYLLFSFALIKQCLDASYEQSADLLATLNSLVYDVCLPLLSPPDRDESDETDRLSASIDETTLQLLLHALGLMDKAPSSWWSRLHSFVLDEFHAAPTRPTYDPTWLGFIVELLFQRKHVSPLFVDGIASVCAAIISSPESAGRLRQAIFGSVVPQLIQHDVAHALALSTQLLTTWSLASLQDACLMLCELFPHCPTVHHAASFHDIVRVGLQQDEAVVRKMALHLLTASVAREPHAHESWSTFIHAFEIVHFHHEQHLMEQVWPSIAALIRHTIVTDAAASAATYASPLPFPWFQGILTRCWHHDNPVVRRMTVTEFMVVAVEAWTPAEATVHPAAIPFVLTELLPSLNDPFLFKHEKYNVRAATEAFCTRFVALAVAAKQLSLLAYLEAVQEAIFGDQTRGNSPNALLAMLAIFADLPPSPMPVDGLNVLRYMVQAHVLQSFPKTMAKLAPLLMRILTAFASAATTPLDVLARFLLLFPLAFVQTHRDAFAAYLASEGPAIGAALELYFTSPTSALSAPALARLVLASPSSLVVPWPTNASLVQVSLLYRDLYASMPSTTLPPASYFDAALARVESWLSIGDAAVDDDAIDLDEQLAVVFLATRLALSAMQTNGDCGPAHALNASLARAVATLSTPHQATLVLQSLDVVAQAPFLMDSLSVFDPQVLVPQLLGASLVKTDKQRHTMYAQRFVDAKYAVLAATLSSCWALGPPLLQQVLDTVLDALPTAGNDPIVLEHMVRVLGLVLPYTVFNLPSDEAKEGALNAVFAQVWAAYTDSRKPDSLTFAVIQALFQPRLMPLTDTLKTWFRKWTRFGEGGRRPNVMFHLATTLCGIWRQYVVALVLLRHIDVVVGRYPKSAIAYVDEIVYLLLYKEPSVDVKEQMVYLTDGMGLKERYVRFIVLAFLEDAPVACHRLMEHLITALLELQLKPDYQKPQMINSDGFGKQLRSWQALCVLSRYVQADNVDAIHALFWHHSFLNHNLPQIRYFIEIFAMRVALAFPDSSFRHLDPLLENVHLMPQLSASLLLVTSIVLRLLPVDDTPDLHLDTLLRMVPWLNSTHGHTRTIVQFVVLTLLPYFASQPAYASRVSFLQPTLRYLSSNKECKRMFRRQTDQMASFVPEKECTLAGLLGGTLNEFDEIVPISIVEQIKETLSASFAQFLKEDRHHGGQYQASVAESLTLASSLSSATTASDEATDGGGAAVVQRKIDPNAAAFLEELLVRNQAESMRDKQVNARRARHQSVIMCASLVDKIPNVAGLARTCEIFNASKLLIPNMSMTEDILFRQISVTANQWVNMEQVKPDEVREYLRRMKKQGYAIVALEQTSSSACLTQFQFPDKVVIVLGNEKEGIPVDILQAVDLCVEIPQMGVIRSLNVHVSGAILLWAYTQQRLLHS